MFPVQFTVPAMRIIINIETCFIQNLLIPPPVIKCSRFLLQVIYACPYSVIYH